MWLSISLMEELTTRIGLWLAAVITATHPSASKQGAITAFFGREIKVDDITGSLFVQRETMHYGERELGIFYFKDHFKLKCHFHFLIHGVLVKSP